MPSPKSLQKVIITPISQWRKPSPREVKNHAQTTLVKCQSRFEPKLSSSEAQILTVLLCGPVLEFLSQPSSYCLPGWVVTHGPLKMHKAS